MTIKHFKRQIKTQNCKVFFTHKNFLLCHSRGWKQYYMLLWNELWLFLITYDWQQASELTMAFSFGIVQTVKVVIYGGKILPSFNFRFCWISSTGNQNKSRFYHWKKDAFFLKHLLFADAGALSLSQGEKILSTHDFFQSSRTTKSKKILSRTEAVLFGEDSTNTFDVSSDI